MVPAIQSILHEVEFYLVAETLPFIPKQVLYEVFYLVVLLTDI